MHALSRSSACIHAHAVVQEVEVGQLTNSHEKWRDLYAVEELPYGNGWKRAEALDPAEPRLFPADAHAPEWVPATQSNAPVSKS